MKRSEISYAQNDSSLENLDRIQPLGLQKRDDDGKIYIGKLGGRFMTAVRLKLQEAAQIPWMRLALKFLNGWFYPAAYALLCLISSLFGLEFLIYAVTVAIVLFVCLFAEDTKALIPPIVLIVYSTSWKHTPQPPYHSSFLNDPRVLGWIIALGAVAVAAMVFRLVVYHRARNFISSPTRLKGGLIALAIAFTLNGIFYSGYVIKDLFFGALIALSYIAVYVLLYSTYRREKGESGVYFAYVLVLASAVILLQVAKLLLFGHTGTPQGTLSVFTEDGSINKDLMIAGWGMSNNVGGMLAMFMPAWLYLAYKFRHGWIFYLFAFVQMGAVAFTLSRSSLLVGGAMLLTGMIVLSAVKSPRRTFFRIFNLVAVCAVIFSCLVFRSKIMEIFAVIFDRGFGDSQRFEIWWNGFLNFLKEPVLGVGFFEPFYVDINIENWVFPDMYHNLLIQTLACCGLVGMLAYMFHFAQVLNLLIRKPTAERLLYFAIFLMISGTSLLDNHIFHVFPALVYSMALVLWEQDAEQDSPLPLGRDRRGLFAFGKKVHDG